MNNKNSGHIDVRQFSSDKILKHIDRVDAWLKGENPYPVTVEIDMTNICNHRCPECSGWYFQDKGHDSLPLDLAMDTIRQIAKAGIRGLIFTGGGDPLCHPGTRDAVKLAHNLGLDIGFITNGSLINRETAALLLKCCRWIRVSLDAASSKTFEKIHGMDGDTFDKLLDNIRLLVKMKKEAKSNTTIGIGYLTSRHTKKEMIAASIICKKIGVDYLQFRPLQIHNNGRFEYHRTDGIEKEILKCLKYSKDGYNVLYSKHKYDMMKEKNFGRNYEKCYGQQFATVIAADARMFVCFGGETKMLIRHKNAIRYLPIRNLENIDLRGAECILNGEFFRIKSFFSRKCKKRGELITILMDNGVKLRVTLEHPIFTDEGIKEARELTGKEKLPFATKPFETNLGNYELGRFIGFYVSEGFMAERYITFSFNEKEKEYIIFLCDFIRKNFGASYSIYKKPQDHCIVIQVSDKSIESLIRTFVSGRTSNEKHLLSKCFSQSIDFRKGLIDGIYQGDADLKTNELHIGSKKLAKDVCCILATLGIPYSFRICNKGESYKVRTLKRPEEANLAGGGITKYEYLQDKSFLWVNIKKIIKPTSKRAKTKYKIDKKVYDIEIESPAHLFQLANGLIVHNCCHMRGNEKYCLGDLKKNTFEEIWNSKQRKKAVENIDFRDCVPLCRDNTFNQILWNIKQPREHVNFL